jgi:hypothetical protein
MKNREIPSKLDPHQRYEEFCALAAAGQLSLEEAGELNQHLEVCHECRESVSEFAYHCVQILPSCLAGPNVGLTAEMTERIIAGARSEGISISGGMKNEMVSQRLEPTHRDPWKVAFWASVAVAVLIAGIFSLLLIHYRQSSSKGASATLSQSAASPSVPATSASGAKATHATAPSLESQVLREQLESAEARLAAASEEMKERQRELRSAKSAKDVLSSRDLRVLEIFPRSEMGNRGPEFGRLFYAKGKTLVLYAFDLDAARSSRVDNTFYGWGEEWDAVKGRTSTVIQLGKFRLDSAKDDRWVLIVTDPGILARLKGLFVTVEPLKTPVKAPTGKRMLVTSLDLFLKSR